MLLLEWLQKQCHHPAQGPTCRPSPLCCKRARRNRLHGCELRAAFLFWPESEVIRAIVAVGYSIQPQSEVIRAIASEGSPQLLRGP